MIKNTLIALVAMISLATFTTPASSMEQALKDAISAVPHINDNCSASVIYSDRDKVTGDVKTVLLTAKHCVVDSQDRDQNVDFQVYENNRVVKKDRYIAKVLGVSYKTDLALLELNDKKTLFQKINKIASKNTILEIGDETVAIGYPFSMGLTFTEGHFLSVIKVPGFDAKNEFIRATPDIGPGNSGGALLRKNGKGEYEQIGVTAAGIPGYPFTGIFTGVDDVREYLKVALPVAIGEETKPAITSPAGK